MNRSSYSIDQQMKPRENEVTREDGKSSTVVIEYVEQQLSLQQQQQESRLENVDSKQESQERQSQDEHEKLRSILERKNQYEEEQQKQQHSFDNGLHVTFGSGGSAALLAALFSAKEFFKVEERSIKEDNTSSQEVNQEQRVQHDHKVQEVFEPNHRYEEDQQKQQHASDNRVDVTFGQGGAGALLSDAFSAEGSWPVIMNQDEIRRFEIEQRRHHKLEQAIAYVQKTEYYSAFLDHHERADMMVEDHLARLPSVASTFTGNMFYDGDGINQLFKSDWTFFKNSFMKNADFSDRARKLLTAARNNDIEEINFSIRSGDNLDVEDDTGIGPILMAVIHKNYNTAKILLRAQVDRKLLGTNPSTNFLYGHHKREIESVNTHSLVQKMISKGFEPTRIGEALAGLSCYIEDVVCHKNSVITKAFLQNCNIVENDPQIIFRPNMLDFDVGHINVLINSGPRSNERKDDFVGYLLENICEYDKFEVGKDFLKKLACWEMMDEELVEIFEYYLKRLPLEYIKIFVKYDFYKIAKEKCNRDMTRIFFGDCSKNTTSVLKKEDIDVAKRHLGGNSLLHIASKNLAASNIRLLLSRDADPNIFNDFGDTPLSLFLKRKEFSHPYAVESIKLLMFAGANPLIISHQFDNTFFGFNSRKILEDNPVFVVKLLVAQLAVYKAVGISVEDFVQKFINLGNEKLIKFYEGCHHQLNRLKRRTSDDDNRYTCKMTFNILKILADRPENIIRYINEENLKAISRLMTTYVNAYKKSLNFYYRDLMKQRVEQIVELYRCRNKAIEVVCDFTGIENSNHLVVQKIVNYFTVRDLKFYKENK